VRKITELWENPQILGFLVAQLGGACHYCGILSIPAITANLHRLDYLNRDDEETPWYLAPSKLICVPCSYKISAAAHLLIQAASNGRMQQLLKKQDPIWIRRNHEICVGLSIKISFLQLILHELWEAGVIRRGIIANDYLARAILKRTKLIPYSAGLKEITHSL